MATYNEAIKINKQEDGTFTLSVAINDFTVVTKRISKTTAESLHIQLDNMLK